MWYRLPDLADDQEKERIYGMLEMHGIPITVYRVKLPRRVVRYKWLYRWAEILYGEAAPSEHDEILDIAGIRDLSKIYPSLEKLARRPRWLAVQWMSAAEAYAHWIYMNDPNSPHNRWRRAISDPAMGGKFSAGLAKLGIDPARLPKPD